MAEKELGGSHESSGLIDKNEILEANEALKSEQDEVSQSRNSQYQQDLKSVLVTSVLNLEKLDVDLYR